MTQLTAAGSDEKTVTPALYIDLVALIAGVVHGSFNYFNNDCSYQETTSDPVIQAGVEQALAYLRETSFSEDLMRTLRTHPLTSDLGLDLSPMQDLLGQTLVSVANFVREGLRLETGHVRFSIRGSAFGVSMVVPMVKNILDFQSYLATNSARDVEKQKRFLGERFIGIMDVSSPRTPNPTIAAYSARARKVGGWSRWTTHRLSEACSSGRTDGSPPGGWRVYSRDIEDGVNRKALMHSSGTLQPPEAQRAYEGGMRGVTVDELASEDLSGYALEGTSKQPRWYYGTNQFLYNQLLVNETLESSQGVLFVDSYYQHLFSPRRIRERALYGKEGLPVLGRSGEAIEEIVADLPRGEDLRAKYWRIPSVKVGTLQQLEDVISRIQNVAPDGHVLFRGQGNHYKLFRPPAINELLYGEQDVNELSLTTSASRSDFDYDRFSDRFQLDLQGVVYMDLDPANFGESAVDVHGYHRFLNPDIAERNIIWKKLGVHWDEIVMGVAQHYRVPTNGLDLTSDLGIALWMALAESGASPVVYLVSTLHPPEELETLEIPGLESTRQRNQQAYLHYGGWAMHKNLCAEEVLLAVFLGDDLRPDLPSEDHVFPDKSHDSLLERLLKLKQYRLQAGYTEGYELLH